MRSKLFFILLLLIGDDCFSCSCDSSNSPELPFIFTNDSRGEENRLETIKNMQSKLKNIKSKGDIQDNAKGTELFIGGVKSLETLKNGRLKVGFEVSENIYGSIKENVYLYADPNNVNFEMGAQYKVIGVYFDDCLWTWAELGNYKID